MVRVFVEQDSLIKLGTSHGTEGAENFYRSENVIAVCSLSDTLYKKTKVGLPRDSDGENERRHLIS